MKLQNIIATLLLIMVSQSVVAIGVIIHNNYQEPVGVDPIWSGNPRGYMQLAYRGNHYYRTGIHHLKGLKVSYANGDCYYYNFEQKDIPSLRGTGSIDIFIGSPGSKIPLSGYTDMLIKGQFMVDVSATKVNC
jgi:hypothetical protein